MVPQGGAAALKCRWALFGLAARPLVGSGTEAGHLFYSSQWTYHARHDTSECSPANQQSVHPSALITGLCPSKGGPTPSGTPRSWHYVLVVTHEAQEQHYAGQALVHPLNPPLAKSQPARAMTTLGPEPIRLHQALTSPTSKEGSDAPKI